MLNSNSSQGLGDLVQRKKEAYQNNPQGLQEKYKQSQQLTDLLALQQLKTEKEAAARNIQLQMDQNPNTIAQQREAEVLDLIKNNQNRSLGNVSKGVAGVLGQKQKAAVGKQASMGIVPPNTGGAPAGMPAGMPAGAPAGAPPVLKAAQGGIIGFAGPDGSSVKGDQNVEVTEEEIVENHGEEFLNYIKENPADAALIGMSFIPGLGLIGAGLKGAKTLGPALPRLAKLAQQYFKKDKGPDFEVTPKGTAVPKDRSQIPSPTSKSKELVPYKGKLDSSRPVDPGKEVGPFTPPKGGGIPTKTTNDALRVGQAGILASIDTKDEKESTDQPQLEKDLTQQEDKGTGTGKAPADADGGVASLLSRFKQEPVSPDYESSTAQKEFARKLTNEIGLDPSRKPEDVRDERMDQSRKEFNLDGDSGILSKKDDQLRRLIEQQERLSKDDKFDRFIAGAAASARRGGPGGYAQGSLNERNSQKAQQRLDLVSQFGIENEKLQLEFDVTQAGTQSADKAADRLSREKQAYSTIMQNANAADRSAAERIAKDVMDTNQFNITTELELLSQENSRRIAAAKGTADEIDRLNNILADSLKERYKILAPLYDLTGAGDTAEELEKKLGTIQIAQGMLSDAAGIFAQEEDTLRRLAGLGVDVSARSEKLAGDKALLEQVRAVQAMEAAEKGSGIFGGMFD